jgi:Thioredoxin domain
LKVEVLIASCCTPVEVMKKVISVLEGMKGEVPDLAWRVIDVSETPELAVNYRAPMTPAIYIDGKLEFMGYPKQAALQAKIKQRATASSAPTSDEKVYPH